MFLGVGANGLQQTTSYKVVLPFYLYAAISFLIATSLLFLHTDIFSQHYFHPQTLAITHTMALGWATMIILGASHQLLPVLVEGKLDSNFLAYATFVFTAIGIPFLIISFYYFKPGWMMQTGAVFVNVGVICYLVNVISSIYESKKMDVHAWFILSASLWLFTTTFFGLLLVFNFSISLLPNDSLEYLTLHAHFGIIGWFLLLIIGVGSRLIPMFLISKYTNPKMLFFILAMIHLSLLSFILIKIFSNNMLHYFIPLALGFIAILMFVKYCHNAYQVRIRKSVDEQMKISLVSVAQMLFPILILFIVLLFIPSKNEERIMMLYGFTIFFGWLTAIILGMTFKTLPFIVWNKVYSRLSSKGKTPIPKDLFREPIFHWMGLSYLLGFLSVISGILLAVDIAIKLGTLFLLFSAILYVYNVFILLLHKSKIS